MPGDKLLLVTGGAGFIGSHLVRRLLTAYPDYRVRVLDALTYAGNKENLADVADNPRYEFVQMDILDSAAHPEVFRDVDYVLHLAAETHNDRAILGPGDFITTDILGTQRLLDAAHQAKVERFVHVSTCEVYGSIREGMFKEDDPFHPNQPYSASKAGGDLIARTYFQTFGVPVIIVRPVNNLGPNQFPEKLIPLMIQQAMDDQPLPVYGDGSQVREWLYVTDCCAAIDTVLHKGVLGQAYNIGANIERKNLDVVRAILRLLGKPDTLIRYVEDRPGHDVRYALDPSKINALGWQAEYTFEMALEETVRWYQNHPEWLAHIKERSAGHREFMREWYGHRLGHTE